MKLFTRCFFLLTVLGLPLGPVLAKIVNVTIGNNFYSPAEVTIDPGDQINFVWQAGVHPTVSDSPTPLWQSFTLSASTPARLLPAFNTPGSFPYHCSAHGSPGNGMNGIIVVRQGTVTSTTNPALAAALNVYPNPSRGQITVQLTQKPGVDYTFRLSNIIGQQLRVIALKPELTSAGLLVDLSDLRTGMYFYSLLADGKVVATKRLVLQN
ncbi:T9SS type A sorting domain-containing protein [Hymenobacter sp. IS2118]|uniref:T9SS type A sorting domain-containing protein n=1 Tax=Hymenobacter sp. IS2118 TaxID=1505605 RepID=UPI00068F428B|nr:T9SS type A sorting domain-containing protein [Hymenobacter sp. IS2118]